MTSVDPSLISDPKENKWVAEIDKIIDHQLDTDVETPPVSLFQVPETITQKKPEAYEPQQIGLGPTHHFRPFPYKKMEQKKVVVMRKILKDYHIKDYKLQIRDKVRNIVPTVRSCYDMFLPDDDDSLARVFVIDGLFLLDLFRTYNAKIEKHLLNLKSIANEVKCENDKYLRLSEKDPVFKLMANEHPLLLQEDLVVTVDNQIEWERILQVDHGLGLPEVGPKERLVAQDVLMVENQIPFMVLKEIHQTLPGNSSHRFSPLVFRVFCEIHSPLELCSKSQAPSSVDHLLHYMYDSIVNNVPVQILPDELDIVLNKPDALGNVYKSRVENTLSFYSKIPHKEIGQLYEQIISTLESFTESKHLIPSASSLHIIAGFKFHRLEADGGIQNIHVREKHIYLPNITLNKDSEVILRNLVAYETLAAESDSFPLNEYMGMMCGLLMTKNDVNYLKRLKIITSDMPGDEVVKLFAAIRSSISQVKTKEKSKLKEVIEEVNKVYESGLMMKAYWLLKKLAHWLLVVLKAIGRKVASSWQIVAFMASAAAMFVITYDAFCDSFGFSCGKKTVTLLPYASS